MQNLISIHKLDNKTLEQLTLQHPCEGNSPDDNCVICNEMARRNLIPSAEEVQEFHAEIECFKTQSHLASCSQHKTNNLQLAHEMGANPSNYN